MAAVNSQKDTDLTLFYNKFFNNAEESRLRRYYNEFLTEAFDFYSMNAKLWKDHEHDPLYDVLEDVNFRYFRAPIKEAVLATAYIHRRTYRGCFNEKIARLGYVDSFFTSVRCYALRRDGFVEDFAGWVAYLFELNLFCKIKKYDFEKICKPYCRNYLSFYSFKFSTLYGLEKVCGPLFTFYFPLADTFHGNYPSCDIIFPYYFAHRTVERVFKYFSINRRLEKLHQSVGDTNKNLSKLHALSSFEPGRIALGYIARRKIISQDESKSTSRETPQTDRKLLLGEGREDCTNASSKIGCLPKNLKPNRKSPLEFDDRKCFFALSKKLLSKRLKAKFDSCESKYKRDIKLYSTVRKEMSLIAELMNILDDNIQKNNLYKITDQLFAVYLTDSKLSDSDKIFVLDTSSDDDDDQLDPDQLDFKSNLIPALRKRKISMAYSHEQFEALFKLPKKFNFSEQSKTPSDAENEVNTKIIGAIGNERESAEQNLGIGKKKKRIRKKNQQEKISIESTKEIPQNISTESTKEKTPEKISIEGMIEKLSIEGTKEKTPEKISIESRKETPEKISIEDMIEKISIESRKETPEKISIEDMIEKLSIEGATENTPENISIESTKEKTSKKKLVLPNFEPCTIAGLRERNREILSMKNTGAEWDSVRQANQYIRESLEYIIGNTLPIFNIPKTELECDMRTKSASANTHLEEISFYPTEVKGRNSTGQILQNSDTVTLNDRQGNISLGNTGAIPKTLKPKRKYEMSSKQLAEKSKRVSETVRPPTEDELVMNKTLKQLEQLEWDETKSEEEE